MIDSRLVIFAKAPRPGYVKTRLVPPLTAEQAAAVCEAALRDVIAGAMGTGVGLTILYDDAPGAATYFAEAFPELDRRAQTRGDLGQRLAEAFAAQFASGVESVVAIGADSPTLPLAHLRAGLTATREMGGALGPTDDGGYYLIGLRRDAWPNAIALFRDIPWSTDQVLETTLDRADRIGLELGVLARWYDIDRIDDLTLARTHADPDSHLARFFEANPGSGAAIGGD